MSYQVEFTAEVIPGLAILTSTIQERLLRKIRWLCENNEYIYSANKFTDII
ncbi:hypothetical protein IQ259_26780 [Fortiea sp. LEGE XX443]|uniref:hypothetical protein n=1 Tax=Fortiea sp. LEGE XX443 TaxID=1828611 RepID=UPI001882CEED|nr:hypothetical protein [Fortiea sp. LEGE XX443]MBE9008548.1 hypothetical protein [Fortiea sp. LEGE XX443]